MTWGCHFQCFSGAVVEVSFIRLFVIATILVFSGWVSKGFAYTGMLAWPNYMEQVMFFYIIFFFLLFYFLVGCCFLNTATAVIVMIKSIKAWVADVLNCIITLYFLLSSIICEKCLGDVGGESSIPSVFVLLPRLLHSYSVHT